MSISVLNTDAGLQATTIINDSGAQTVTGLKTFDRDPNAPFAVSANSAVVTNLDADKLDGLEASAFVQSAAVVTSSWTPTWTGTGSNPAIGNGTIAGRYVQIGKLVFADLSITMGGTTTFGSGTWEFTYPVTAANTVGQTGAARINDNGTAFFVGVVVPETTAKFRIHTDAGTTPLGTTTPHTWAANDVLVVTFFYIAA